MKNTAMAEVKILDGSPDAEPEDEDRGESDLGQGVEEGEEGTEGPGRSPPPPKYETDDDAGCGPERPTEHRLPEGDDQILPEQPFAEQSGERAAGLTRAGGEQGIDPLRIDGELPQEDEGDDDRDPSQLGYRIDQPFDPLPRRLGWERDRLFGTGVGIGVGGGPQGSVGWGVRRSHCATPATVRVPAR